MGKQLELLFENEAERQVTVSIDAPIEPVDANAVKNAMEQVIATNALTSSGGDVVGIRGARIVERHVEIIELPS